MRHKHSLSHYKLLTCDMGELVPIACMEVLPGDTFQQMTSTLIRLSPLVAPMMHPVEVKIHHWFVPYRIIWDDFEDFITGGDDGMDATVFPTCNLTNVSVGTLADYLGIPTQVANTLSVSALPFRAYNLIFNEFYRDQDLQAELTINYGNGVDATTLRNIQNVAWEKDRFTTARPWPQKGPQVTMPLGVSAPVVSSGDRPTFDSHPNASVFDERQAQIAPNNSLAVEGAGIAANTPWMFGNVTGLEADLTGATAATIDELRRAFALQRYSEARALYGSQYTEYLRYIGVRSSDARLQRPEYLGGGKAPVQISEILQTAPTTSGSAVGVGNLKGHGLGAMRSNRYRRFFEEHGLVLTLLSVKPRTMYYQGLAKQWSRRSKEDFYQRELEHIGQEPIYNREVYAAHATPDGVFGYNDRYDDYRHVQSSISGEFRGSTLNFWHMARDLSGGADPALNETFIKSNPTKRVFAVNSTDCLWIMARHSIQARRMVARGGMPGRAL